jgi:hypothetical protein
MSFRLGLSGGAVQYDNIIVPPDDTWHTYTSTFVATSTIAAVTFYMNQATAGTMWVDSVSFTAGETSPLSWAEPAGALKGGPPTGYTTPTNYTGTRAMGDVLNSTLFNTASVLATLIQDLKARGVISA